LGAVFLTFRHDKYELDTAKVLLLFDTTKFFRDFCDFSRNSAIFPRKVWFFVVSSGFLREFGAVFGGEATPLRIQKSD